ncbi:hypothetical protein [Pseudorhodoferax sp. Leaf267]|jgi:hypothetical protein|uniref:hypothetical protein n=1 Tax=Pseudorhodoferax sp. Leaf267 TaxID=1736316 RepID=UPI0006F4B715|nr:hypothetical protein [Pseudorhodoferax sp. Leaf267]KQP14792.1 hypothetical protein ASF43_12045 [Pseudorhodoferax sp. Leaf267]
MLELERLAQDVVDQWETGHLADAVRALAAELADLRTERRACQRYIAKARNDALTPDSNLDIGDHPLTAKAEDGYWIGAWVMVRHDDVQEAEHG